MIIINDKLFTILCANSFKAAQSNKFRPVGKVSVLSVRQWLTPPGNVTENGRMIRTGSSNGIFFKCGKSSSSGNGGYDKMFSFVISRRGSGLTG